MTEPQHPRETPREGLPIGRAAFLGTVALGVGGIAVLSRFAGSVQRAVQDVSAAVPIVNQIAPTTGWRIYTVADTMPRFDPAAFRLKVTGLVDAPQDLSWSEVDALAIVQQRSDFHCVTGWSVEGVTWAGVRPQTLLDLVRPRPEATHVSFVSLEDPYVDQLTLDQFRQPDVLLAKAQDGRPLKREHGAPLRLVIPRMYGYKSVKWVSEIRFESRVNPGYWEERGYDVDAWVGKSNGLG
jgi:DMSO/TMAO reductase YedYZ molybdopterin-dependent catalytic subunit